MSIQLNKAPYFDDFDKSKNFYRILFKGRNAVQIRELNQLQSIVGDQLEQFADHIFKYGSIVKDVSLKYNSSLSYIRLKDFDMSGSPVNLRKFTGRTVIGGSSGIKAKVLHISEKTEYDPPTLHVKYENSGIHPLTQDNVKEFIWGEEIWVLDPNNEALVLYKDAIVRCPTCDNSLDGDVDVNPTGRGSSFSVSEGIYYIKGKFVRVHDQTIILDKYRTDPSYDIGLDVLEEVISADDDNSLYDNALDSPNFAAPGADRLKVSLNLVKKKEKSVTNDAFILVARTEKGILTQLYDKSQYADLMETIARRTYDESGDYTITPFKLYFKEHLKLNEDDANGFLLPNEGGDESKLIAFMQSGKAYVRGHEIEKISDSPVDMRKSRDTGKQRFSATRIGYSNYILVKLDAGSNVFVNGDILNSSYSYDFKEFSVYDGEASGLNPTGTVVGTFLAKGIELYKGPANSEDAIWKIYIFNTNFISGKTILDAKSIKNSGNGVLVANLLSDGEIIGGIDNANSVFKIYDTSNNKLIWTLPKDHVKSIKDYDNPNVNNTLLSIKKKYSGSVSGSGFITFNSENGERFGSYNPRTWVIGIYNGSNYVPIEPVNVTASQSSITLEVGSTNANKSLIVLADTYVPGAMEKRKSITTEIINNLNLSNLDGNKIWLKQADIYSVDDIIMFNSGDSHTGETAISIKDWFNIDNGQHDNYYGIGSISLKTQYQASDFNNKLCYIRFRYFQHSISGYYFSIDSYREVIEDPTLDVNYETIPSYTTMAGDIVKLSNAIDFRPRQGWDTTANTPAFVGNNVIGAQLLELPANGTDVIYDIEFYLARVDLICLHKNGNFFIEEGIPAESPVAKKVPEHSMKLYEVHLKPYVYDFKKDVNPKFFENRRYTMRDIGKLEKRIEGLEYYVSFNLLEKSTADMNIVDANGLNRFKNGFLVDPFTDFKASQLNTNQFKVCIDTEHKECRPSFDSNNVGLILDTGNSQNYQVSSHLLTLPYSEVVQQSQPYAAKTLSVNPYEIFNMNGVLKLNPDHDVWIDTKHAPTFNASLDLGLQDIDVTKINPNNIFWDGWLQGEPLNIDLGQRVTDVQMVTYMRELDVQFMGSKMRPNTKVYAFFDGEDVTKYCRPINGKHSDALTTNDQGEIIGTFSIPKEKFFVGQKLFELTDEKTNAGDADERTTSAIAKFHAGGLQQTVEEGTLNVKPPEVLSGCEWGGTIYSDGTFLESESHYAVHRSSDFYTEGQSSIVSRTPFNDIGARCVKGTWELFDPVAQSFTAGIQGGMFVTKLNLYFSAKDSKAPVFVQIREMSNGYPTLKMLAGGESIKRPENVNISENASVATEFKFPYPIYLEEGKEYCFVVISTSPSYRVHVSKLGGTDILTGSLISKQPHMGSLFKSQNNTTWTAEQYEDIKFELFRAKFNQSGNLKVAFTNDNVSDFTELSDNPFETLSSSNKVRVYHPNHCFIPGDKVRFNVLTETWYKLIITTGDIVAGEKLTGNTNAGSFNIKQLEKTDETYSYNGKVYNVYKFLLNNLIGRFAKDEGYIGTSIVDPIKDSKMIETLDINPSRFTKTKPVSVGLIIDEINYDINGIPLDEINKNVHTIQAVDSWDSYIIHTSSLATTTGRTFGTGVFAESNKQIDLFRVRLKTIDFDFAPKWIYDSVSHSGIGGAFDNYVNKSASCNLNEHTYIEEPLKLCNKLNEDLIISQKSFKLVGEYTSTSSGLDNLSPVIDLTSGNLTIITNIINNQTADDYNVEPIHDVQDQYIEEDDSSYPNEGKAISKYISQIGNLKIPATSLKIYLDCYKNVFSDIKVYYRTVKTFEDTSIDNAVWIYAPFDNDFISEKPDEFIEGEISIPSSESGATEVDEFKSYQIKVVLNSTNSAKPPRLKNLRTIATT